MTTTTATRSEKTGQRRTNLWSVEELSKLFFLKERNLSYKEIAQTLSSYRKENKNKPPLSRYAVMRKYKREIKRIEEQNESNIKR